MSLNNDKEYIVFETVVKIFSKRFIPFKNYSKRVKVIIFNKFNSICF